MHTHTPGPWTIAGEEHANVIYGKDFVVADVYCHQPDEAGPRTDEEADANARLIAAAPELKDLLFHALHYVETPGDFTESERLELCEDIETLIARAEGKEPRP